MTAGDLFDRLFAVRRANVGRRADHFPRHFNDSRLARCCNARCWLHLSYRVARDRGAAFDPAAFWFACEVGPQVGYADADTWAMWGLNRLEETAGYKPQVGGRVTPTLVSCELHVGFLHIPETEVHLANLRNEVLAPKVAAEARSKIFQTQKIPVPIDATAARVAPQK